jgi:N-acetylglutamate synthase-like GNAT family acetyltransferase
LFRKDEEDKTRRIEHLLSDLGKYEKMIKKMQESYMQKEHDYTVCEQRMQEIQEKAL